MGKLNKENHKTRRIFVSLDATCLYRAKLTVDIQFHSTVINLYIPATTLVFFCLTGKLIFPQTTAGYAGCS